MFPFLINFVPYKSISLTLLIMKKLSALIFLLLLMTFSCLAQDKKINVLVFSKTMGFRHNSVSSGLKMMSDLAPERKWIITATENADLFTADFLRTFDVVVFLNPTIVFSLY